MSKWSVAGVLAGGLLLASCAGQSSDDDSAGISSETVADSADSGASGGTFRVVVPEDFDSLDPHKGLGNSHATWLPLMYETLVGLDVNAEVTDGLASSWEISDDGMTYTFDLRDGATFHNGREVVSEDIAYNIERILDPETGAGQATALSVIEEVQTPDDDTVVLELSAPSAPLLSDLAFPGRVGILAPEAVGDDDEIAEHIGTGPFVFGDYSLNDRLALERYDDYWDGPANLEAVEIRIVPDAMSRLAAVTSGEVEMAWQPPPADAQAAAEGGQIVVQEIPENRGNYLSINVARPPFDDERVRRAMHLAISRQAIADAGWNGFAVPTRQPFFADSPWYLDGDVRTDADLDEARRLLDEVGAEDLSVTILQWDALGSDTEAQVVASAWEEIGISTKIELMDIGTLVERASSGDYDVLYIWVGVILDPTRPYEYFKSDSSRNWGSGGIQDEQMDAWYSQARTESDPAERKQLYGQILDANYDMAGMFYTVRPQNFVALSPRVEGYDQGTYNVHYRGGGLTAATLSD